MTDRQQTLLQLFFLAGLAMLFTWPALIYGLPDLSADGIEQVRWTRNFSLELWQGEIYPRWLSETNGGLGSPALFFYPSLANYGAALFRPLLAPADPYGWLIAGWSGVLAAILSAITTYFWLRDGTNPRAALFGAAVYTISPYHMAIDFYNRGALPEFWAFVWMPLVMMFLKRCIDGRRWAIPGLAVSYGLLVFTHLPSVVCFSWVVPVGVWFLSEPRKRAAAFVRTFTGIALGIGLGAVYVLPAMLDQNKSWIADLVNGDSWFYYRNNFLFIKIVSLLEYRVRVLVLVLSMAACTGLFYWIVHRFEADLRQRRIALLYLIVGAGALVMMTHLSIPVYELFKFVQTIQFPSRFASTLTVALAALAALAFPFLKKQPWMVLIAGGMIMLGWIGADAWAGATGFSAWRQIPLDRAAKDRDKLELQAEYYQFWPKPADCLRLSDPSALRAFLAAHPARSLVLDKAGTASVERWRPREIYIKVHAPEGGRMTVGHFYYRDWRARVPGSMGPRMEVTPSPEGLIEIDTPRGDYTLRLELIRDTPEQMGIWISALSLVLISGLALKSSFATDSRQS